MQWVIQEMRLDVGPLSINVSRVHAALFSAYAHLIALVGETRLAVCHCPGMAASMAETQALVHDYVTKLGPVEPVLALLTFFHFDRERPTARRLATGRASLRKTRARRRAA